MPDTPTSPPSQLLVGDTLEFLQVIPSDLLAGWTGAARLTGPDGSQMDATSVAVEGSSLRIKFAGQATGGTKSLLAGRHTISVWMTNASDRHTIAQHAIDLVANPAVGTPELAHAEKMLALCETAIENRLSANADGGIEEYDIEGTQVRKFAIRELYALRSKYAAEVRRLRQPDAAYPKVVIGFTKAGAMPNHVVRRYG